MPFVLLEIRDRQGIFMQQHELPEIVSPGEMEQDLPRPDNGGDEKPVPLPFLRNGFPVIRDRKHITGLHAGGTALR